MYQVLCTRDWGPPLITDLEHEGLECQAEESGLNGEEKKPLKIVKQEGQQAGGPSAETTSDSSVSL